jgi:hypothetical protein
MSSDDTLSFAVLNNGLNIPGDSQAQEVLAPRKQQLAARDKFDQPSLRS